jgi:hypothetical protein
VALGLGEEDGAVEACRAVFSGQYRLVELDADPTIAESLDGSFESDRASGGLGSRAEAHGDLIPAVAWLPLFVQQLALNPTAL